MLNSMWGVRCVWLRYFDVFKKNLIFGVVTTFFEPLLYLFSFGFGLGAVVPDLVVDGHTLTYRQFVLGGIVGQVVLFQSFFEAAYGSFVRMYYQRIFHAMAMTPITLSEVLWGELLWDSFRATLSVISVTAVAVILGDFSLGGALILLPIAFLTSLLFSAVGLLSAAKSNTIDMLSYPQYLIIFPMFLFCGVFFPIENLPQWLQGLVWLFPLTPFVSIVRSLVTGLPTTWYAPILLLGWFLILVPWSRRAMTKRIVL